MPSPSPRLQLATTARHDARHEPSATTPKPPRSTAIRLGTGEIVYDNVRKDRAAFSAASERGADLDKAPHGSSVPS